MSRKRLSTFRRTTRAIRARLMLLAFERPLIREAETRKAMKSDEALLSFARRHEVCLDWLICGKLRGLLLMAEWARRPGSYAAGMPVVRSRSVMSASAPIADMTGARSACPLWANKRHRSRMAAQSAGIVN
jgi:hypothetical protein